MNKGIVLSALTVAIAGGMGYSFYEQINRTSISDNLFSNIVRMNDTLNGIDTNINTIFSSNNQDLINSNFSKMDFNWKRLTGDSGRLMQFYNENEVSLQSKKEAFGTLKIATSNIYEIVKDLLNSKEDLIEQKTLSIRNNELINNIEIAKATIEDNLNTMKDNKEQLNAMRAASEIKITNEEVNRRIKALNSHIEDVKKIRDDFFSKSNYVKYVTQLRNDYDYILNNLGQIAIKDAIFQRNIQAYANRFEEFRKALAENQTKDRAKFDDDAYKNTLQDIQKSLMEISKVDGSSYFYYYVLIGLTLVLILMSLISVNTKAQLTSNEKKQLANYKSWKLRLGNLENSLSSIVKKEDNGTIHIQSNSFIQLEPFKDSRFEAPIMNINTILKFYNDVNAKIELLDKATQELVRPVITVIDNLKKETGKNYTDFSLSEASGSIDSVKEIRETLDNQEVRLDKMEAEASNIEQNLSLASSALKENKERFKATRSNMQNSSKSIKLIGESTQKASDIQDDIHNIVSKINVIYLNLAIEGTQSSNSNFSNMAKELKEIVENYNEQHDALKDKIKDIQTAAKSSTDLLETTTNEIIEDSHLLENSLATINSLLESAKKIGSENDGVSENINKLDSQIKVLDEKLEILKEKDNKKSDAIARSSNAIIRINEILTKKM